MKIINTIINQQTDATQKVKFKSIKKHKPICTLLEEYYTELLRLHPPNSNFSVRTKKLNGIVYTTFQLLSIELAIIGDKKLAGIVCDLLFCVHEEVFKVQLPEKNHLEKKLVELILNYCRLIKPSKVELVVLSLLKLQEKIPTLKVRVINNKNLIGTCVMWQKDMSQMLELERLMSLTPWFSKDFLLINFFGNKKSVPVLWCKEYYLGHLALLLHLLNEYFYISADRGKGYMKMAARHIRCDGKRVKEARLHKLSTEILSNPEKNKYLISSIREMIEAIANVKDKSPSISVESEPKN